ncbi:MAG: hypothetical protein FWH17_03055 [Oscillospiraceae bacterium]|nr:hypothetical protein [Oscillospiraceae bacterium]
MKKYVSLFLALILIFIVTLGCENKGSPQPDSNGLDSHNTTDAGSKNIDVDVDLTALSSTMIYAEVYNIMTNPDDYMGKRIKMRGPYYASYFDETGSYYHYVIVEDAAACCMQGLEFIWNGEHIYPDDYPQDKAIVEIIGVFGSYDELNETYYYLSVDDITAVN